MEIDQLTVTSISLTFRTNTFLRESDDLVPLDTPHIVFLRSVTATERHSLAYDRKLSNVFTIREHFYAPYDLNFDENNTFAIPLTADSLSNLRPLSLVLRAPNHHS